MKKFYELIVVIPVGPGANLEFVADTITSLIHYARSTYRIFIMDDSGENAGIELRKRFPDLDIHNTPRSLGRMGGLYINLSVTYRRVLERYRFTAVLKLDMDALVTAGYPEEAALALLRLDTAVGIAGRYAGDYQGRPRDTGDPRGESRDTGDPRRESRDAGDPWRKPWDAAWSFIKRPRASWILWKLHKQALDNGYVMGERVSGGACFISEALLIKLNEAGWLPDYRLRSLDVGADYLFGLLARAAGFGLAHLSEADMPFAFAGKGLAASPEGQKQETTESLNIRMHE